MNPWLRKLYMLAEKPERRILGLMSGTSLDGLDLALCSISGFGKSIRLKLEAYHTIPYQPKIQAQIKNVFAQMHVNMREISGLHSQLAHLHAQWVLDTLQKWDIAPSSIDLLASHGQTIFHAPQRFFQEALWPDNTFQIVDGDHLAYLTGIITLSDFRQKHVVAGGEGAPLAIYGDYLLFHSAEEDRILLNLGGIANFTYLPKNNHQIFASDTGPANTLLNQYMQRYFAQDYDHDGREARKGQVHAALLHQLLQHPFFEEEMPKTTGPEQFHLAFVEECQKLSGTTHLNQNDVLATLCSLTAMSIAQAIRKTTSEPTSILVSGGGYYNPTLMHYLQQELHDHRISGISALGIPEDAKEAVLFALLANECVAGQAEVFNPITKAPSIYMGKISLP